MAQYIVEKGGVRYGMFETVREARAWAEKNLGGDMRHVYELFDKSSAEPPRLNVGDVVRAKAKDRRVGIHFYMPGGSEGVVARTDEANVVVMFHASHPSAPDKEWTSQRVDRRDLIKIAHACSHL